MRDIVTGKPYKSAEKRSIVKVVRPWYSGNDMEIILHLGNNSGKQLAITACLGS